MPIWAVSLIEIGAVIGMILGVLPVMIWLERKVCAYIQDRVGPNRASLFGTVRMGGLVHSLSDAIKLLAKEDLRPALANRLFYFVAPFLVVVPPIVAGAVIPWAHPFTIGQTLVPMQVAPVDIGLLFVFAISGLSVVGIMLAGWASNNKYSLLGALRAASQLVSYEVSLTLSAVTMMLFYGTVRLEEMVKLQGGTWLGFLPRWGVVAAFPLGAIACVVFLIAIFAESNRLPFDLPEGESELVAGYHTEYSGFRFALFMMAEYTHMIVASTVLATVFFGGWQIPWVDPETLPGHARTVAQVLAGVHVITFGVVALALWRRGLLGPKRYRDRRDVEPLLGAFLFSLLAAGCLVLTVAMPAAFSDTAASLVVALAEVMTLAAKVLVFLLLFLVVRWTLPRFRFDQVMRLGWRMLLPAALALIGAAGLVVLWRHGGPYT